MRDAELLRATVARPDPLRSNLITAGAVAVWASAFPATDRLLLAWDPVLLVPFRLGIGALTLGLLLLVTGRIGELGRAPLVDVLWVGGLGGVGVIMFVVGQNFSGAVTTSVIATMGPVVALLMAAWSGRGRPTRFGLLGVMLAVAGGVLASVGGERGSAGFSGGEILVLAAVALWTWYSHAAVHRLAAIGDVARSSLLLGAGALVAGLLAAAGLLSGLASPRADFSPASLAWLLWLGGVAVGLSLPPWFLGVRRLGITVASMHQNLAPAYVMMMALALGGALHTWQVVGAGLVIAGAAISQRGRG